MKKKMEEEDLSFRGIRPGEQIVMTTRQHAWRLMPVVYYWLLAIVVTFVVLKFFGASKVFSITVGALAVVGLFFSLYRYFIWNNGISIVTNQRVIKVNQRGLFAREISEAEIERIQEVSTRIVGPIHTMLNFGDVDIDTASDNGKIDLKDVSDPYNVQQAIVKFQREFLARHGGDSHMLR